MARKKKEQPILNNVTISDVAAEGKAIAKVKMKPEDESSLAIFIPYGAPGDIADIKIIRKKNNYADAEIVRIETPSPIRIEPKCPLFGTCGGCKWQHLPYDAQLEFKQRQVEDAFKRIAKIEFPELSKIKGSEDIWRYRNKMEYTFSDKEWIPYREFIELKTNDSNTIFENDEYKNIDEVKKDGALGFHIPGFFDKVIQVNKCFLQSEKGDKIRNFIYDIAKKRGYSFYNIKGNKGFLRTLMIRIAVTGEIMVCVTFGEDDQEKIKDLLSEIEKTFPEIKSIVYVINSKLNDSIADLEVHTFKGNDFIEEEMEGLKFRVNAKSFYQTNSKQAYELYKIVRRMAGLNEQTVDGEKPVVYDLYTGAGTIANFIARNAEKVIGIEYVEEAIVDAKINSKVNDITNTVFYAGDMKDILTPAFIIENGTPDIMIIDPPRAGMHEKVVKTILDAAPRKIVYVSCNPSTQARDLALLDEKYKVTEVQPVDMFPHTHHVENVVRLELK